MKLPNILVRYILKYIEKTTNKRQADFVVKSEPSLYNTSLYLLRWYLIPRNRFFNIYFHEFNKSDDDRALHDHPWLFNVSLLLYGSYREHTDKNSKWIFTNELRFRWGKSKHRLELLNTVNGFVPCKTLFITGPKVRNWGFYCNKGFVLHSEFTKQDPVNLNKSKGCN